MPVASPKAGQNPLGREGRASERAMIACRSEFYLSADFATRKTGIVQIDVPHATQQVRFLQCGFIQHDHSAVGTAGTCGKAGDIHQYAGISATHGRSMKVHTAEVGCQAIPADGVRQHLVAFVVANVQRAAGTAGNGRYFLGASYYYAGAGHHVTFRVIVFFAAYQCHGQRAQQQGAFQHVFHGIKRICLKADTAADNTRIETGKKIFKPLVT